LCRAQTKSFAFPEKARFSAFIRDHYQPETVRQDFNHAVSTGKGPEYLASAKDADQIPGKQKRRDFCKYDSMRR
jgi:hypothetical protein